MKNKAFQAPSRGSFARVARSARLVRLARRANLAAGALLLVTCASDPPPSDEDEAAGGGGAGGAAVAVTAATAATTTSQTSGNGGAPACDPPRPDVIPDGWVAWTDWSCACPFWIPPSDALMPAPLQWEPCVGQPMPGIECQQLVIDWEYEPTIPIGISPRFGRNLADEPFVLLSRQITGPEDPYADYLVARLDGSIVLSMRLEGEWDERCTLNPSDLNEGRWAFHIYGDGSTKDTFDSNANGLIYGDIGDRVPRVGPLRDDTDEVWSWKIGQEWIIKEIAPALVDELYEPDFTFKQTMWSPAADPDGLPSFPAKIVGRDILFSVGNLSMLGIMAYDDVLGVHPLVRWYGDTAQGAGNVGTDGKHLVWTYGEQKPPGDLVYPVLSVMAAEYTTDPAVLAPKRLRSDPYGSTGDPFVVGCGYAAHKLTSKAMLLVRIADGVSWTLADDPTWIWAKALGLTCDELFLLVGTNAIQRPNIARVRIDSLGPGIPPD